MALGEAATRLWEAGAEGLGSGVGGRPRGRQSVEVVEEVATMTWIGPTGREAVMAAAMAAMAAMRQRHESRRWLNACVV